MRKMSRRNDTCMREALDRVGAAIDRWYERRQRRQAVIAELALGPSGPLFNVATRDLLLPIN